MRDSHVKCLINIPGLMLMSESGITVLYSIYAQETFKACINIYISN